MHKGRREFLSQFRAYADEAAQQLRAGAARGVDVRRLEARLERSASTTRKRSRSIATCSSCARAIRSSRSRTARRSTARRCRSRRSCCAGSTPSTATACWSSTSIASCRSTPPSEPLLAPPHGATLAAVVVERGSALRRPRRHDARRRRRPRRMAAAGAERGAAGRGTRRDPDGSRTQIVLRWDRDRDPLELRRREWLITNGLGGYASGTIAGIPTRKYHGLFVPNLAAPKGRHIMISRCDESVVTPARPAASRRRRVRERALRRRVAPLSQGVPARPSHRGVDLRARRRACSRNPS